MSKKQTNVKQWTFYKITDPYYLKVSMSWKTMRDWTLPRLHKTVETHQLKGVLGPKLSEFGKRKTTW